MEASIDNIATAFPQTTHSVEVLLQEHLARTSYEHGSLDVLVDDLVTLGDGVPQQTMTSADDQLCDHAPPYADVVSGPKRPTLMETMDICSCHCHCRASSETPEWIHGITGTFHYARSVATTCNVEECQVRCFGRALSTSLTWRPPRWSPIQRAVAFNIETTFFTNPRYSLSFPRQVSGGAKIFQCAVTGNLDALKMLMQSGMASPDDQKWNSGFTALHVSRGYRQFLQQHRD